MTKKPNGGIKDGFYTASSDPRTPVPTGFKRMPRDEVAKINKEGAEIMHECRLTCTEFNRLNHE